MMNISSDFIQKARNAPETESYFTAVELQKLDDLIVETQVNWWKPEYTILNYFSIKLTKL